MTGRPAKIIAAIASILLFSTVLVDNTDNLLGDVKDEFLQKIEDLELNANMKEFVQKNRYFCINGKNPLHLNAKQQLEEFKKGPCAPLTIMPGVLGSSLQVMIDCEVLQAQNPSIFSNCGWSTCSRFNIFGKRPASEYRLWVGSIFSKTKLLQLKDSKCFGDLISLKYNESTNKLEDHQGVHVTWYGNTPETKSKSDCGANAIKDFTDDPVMKKTTYALNGFHNLIDALNELGYQSGLTFQSLPYDFRQSVAENETKLVISSAINQLHRLTGKKTILVAHSLGSLHTLDALSTLSPSFKNEKIKQFIAIGPPFIGAPKGFKNIIGGDPDYIQNVLGVQVGINFYSQSKFAYSSSSTFDLLPKNTFSQFKDEPWLNELIKRVEYEKSPSYFSSAPFKNLFPEPEIECMDYQNSAFFRQETKCQSGLINLLEDAILDIENNQYKATEEDVLKILQQYTQEDPKILIDLYNKAQSAEGLNKLVNPGVPTTIIFGGMLETVRALEYNNNPKDIVRQKQDFYFPEHQFSTIGDGTVPTYSAITPAFKWAYEFENNHPNSQPIKLIEYCSKYAMDKPFYDNTLETGEKTVSSNSYQGIPCECEKSDKVDKCTHSCLINDINVIETLFEAISTNEKSSNATDYTLDQLITIQSECPVLYHQQILKEYA